MLKNKKDKKYNKIQPRFLMIFLIILFVVGMLIGITFIINKDTVFNESEIIISKDNCVFEQLSFNNDKGLEESVAIAEKVFKADGDIFKSKTKKISANEIGKSKYGNKHVQYYIEYNKKLSPTENYKEMSYLYHTYNDGKREKTSVNFRYEHYIGGNNVLNMDPDFIIEDIENVFGELEDKESFRKILENEKVLIRDKIYCDKIYWGIKETCFKTKSGVDIFIYSAYNDMTCGVTISASHHVVF